ncbi:MAG: TetR/AcrR family transcriptional regulator [Actinobacteria bacterium]|nr:TetR/AcrR family transcriptional regulator [Actinomycetota bacterium]
MSDENVIPLAREITPPLETPRVRMSGAERREQLIRVGREVFAERGYEGTAIEEIAERAKVSKPVIYEHFGGKEGLHAVIIDRAVQDLMGRLQRALEAGHPREAVVHAAETFLGFVEEEASAFRVLVQDAPAGSGGGSLPSVLADVAASVEALMVRELKEHGYDKKMAPILARALVGMVAHTGLWWLEARKPKRSVVAAYIVNLAWNGLKDLDRNPEARTP